jgi:hypothetical protein
MLQDVSSGESFEEHTRFLLVAAGCINTTRLTLRSRRGFRRPLTILDNPTLRVPLVVWRYFGEPLERSAGGLVQLNLVWDIEGGRIRTQGTILELNSPRRAEFFKAFPFPASCNVKMVKYWLPCMLGMQLYFPAHAVAPGEISLEEDGRLTIACKSFEPSGDVLAALTRRLGMMGALTHPKLISPLPPGGAMHYAGTLPMKKCPGEFECFPDGRLSGSTRVFIADGANFSHLPAKNNSLTIMANSMRITDRLIDRASSVDVES